jgi:CheY-like chemotaxis protein
MHDVALSERTAVNGRKILVIDDDVAIRTLFDALLKRAGCEVDHAEDGDQGRSKLDGDNGYSAIILDLMMPNLNGLELLDHLSRSKPSMLKKIIVTTGASRTYLERVDTKSIHALIRKPFDIDVLLQAVLTCGENGDA